MRTLLAVVLVHFVLCTKTAEDIEKETIYMPEDCQLKVATGDKVKAHYRGKFEDGREFDNSYDRGQAFEFEIGRGNVIQGWERGVMGACLGEKFRLKVPHIYAYGERGIDGHIPPRSNLIFDLEVVGINGKLMAQQKKDL